MHCSERLHQTEDMPVCIRSAQVNPPDWKSYEQDVDPTVLGALRKAFEGEDSYLLALLHYCPDALYS